MPRLTLYGMYAYDESLLDGVQLPAGYNNQLMKDEIIANCGDLYPYIQALPYLKRNIKNWFDRNSYNFAQMLAAMTSEYSPIENYNRYEDLNRDLTDDIDETSQSKNNSKGNSSSSQTSNSDSIGQVSAYDGGEDFTNRDKQIGSGKASGTTQSSGESTGTGTASRDEKLNEKQKNHIHGNIGVTTNQEMILAELDLRTKNDLYTLIKNMFEYEFLVEVY